MEWINVKDQLPKVGHEVNVVTETSRGTRVTALCLYLNGAGQWYWDNNYGSGNIHLMDAVKYWQPLPEPPHQPKSIHQYSTKQDPDVWIDASEDEYNVGQHLSRYNWREVVK